MRDVYNVSERKRYLSPLKLKPQVSDTAAAFSVCPLGFQSYLGPTFAYFFEKEMCILFLCTLCRYNLFLFFILQDISQETSLTVRKKKHCTFLTVLGQLQIIGHLMVRLIPF